jgi:hypothetical protein
MTANQIVGLVIIVGGAVLFVGVGALFLVARGSSRWAQTEGRILSAGFATGTSVDATNAGGYWVSLKVEYEYQVGDRMLTGHRVWFGQSLWNRQWAPRPEQRHVPFTPDQRVPVYYDPAHPERCTLWRHVPVDRFRDLLIVAAIFFLAGIGVMTGHIAVHN